MNEAQQKEYDRFREVPIEEAVAKLWLELNKK